MLESRMLRKICGPKGWELTANWRRLHSTGPYELFSIPDASSVNLSRNMPWVGYVARTGQMINTYRVSGQIHDGKRALGRAECDGVYSCKHVLKADGVMDWINLAQTRDKLLMLLGQCWITSVSTGGGDRGVFSANRRTYGSQWLLSMRLIGWLV
jgi:hypothetical protein